MASLSVLRLAAGAGMRQWLADVRFLLPVAASLTAILLPLILLMATRTGVLGGMADGLEKAPGLRELAVAETRPYPASLFATLAARSETGFVAPSTRFLAASAQFSLGRDLEGRLALQDVDLVGSTAGDPLLSDPARPLGAGEVALTAAAAEALRVSAGGDVTLHVARRTVTGDFEVRRRVLRVREVLPTERSYRVAALIDLPVLFGIERWRDTAAPDPFQPVPVATLTSAPSFRLYARTVDGVEPLRRYLAEQDIRTITRAEEIATFQRQRRSIELLLSIMLAVGFVGGSLGLSASLMAIVERRLPVINTLRLMGWTRQDLAVMSLVEAGLTVLTALVAALVCYAAVHAAATGILETLTPGSGFRLQLSGIDIATLLAGMAGLAIAGTGPILSRIWRVRPSIGGENAS